MTAAEPKYFKQILFVYALFVVTVLVHFPVLLNGIINWQDDELFLSLHALSGNILSVNTQQIHAPGMMLWFRLQFMIGGDGHFIYHAVSILLHTVNAVLLYLLLLRFRWSLTSAGSVALLFALHPIHTGTVAMISSQPVLLTMLFLLLFVRFYHAYLTEQRRLSFVTALLAAAAFTALGYPSLLIVLAGVLLHWSFRRRMTRNELLPLALLWTVSVLPHVITAGFFTTVWPLFSGSVTMLRFGLAEQTMRLFIPWSADLLVPSSEMAASAAHGKYLIPFTVLSVAAAAFAVRKKHPFLFIAVVIIIAGSLPLVTGMERGEWLLSDDGTYLPSVGWFIAVIGAAAAAADRFQPLKRFRAMALTFGVLVSIPLAGTTLLRSAAWETGETFWSRALEEQPDRLFALVKKGMYHYFRYEIEPSLKVLDRAVTLAPNDVEVRYSRGLVHLSAMNLPQATRDYTDALRLDSTHSNAHFGIGSIHALYSRHDSAVQSFSRAIRYSSTYYEAYSERAVSLIALRKYSEALADFQTATSIAPTYGKIYGDRGVMWLQLGNAGEAASDFARQSELEPRNIAARMNNAMASIMLADTAAAVLQFSKAMEIDSLRANLYLMAAGETMLRTPEERGLGEFVFRRSKFGKF
ncbi:MAG: tetratricopeptide repeat protein [Bacteroidetes bacterium]|nr:tetratricopeptide repeat protein [Bacteroidota bacterium]